MEIFILVRQEYLLIYAHGHASPSEARPSLHLHALGYAQHESAIVP